MTAENLKKMADQVRMIKALELDSKSASSSERKVSSSDSESRSGKNDCAKTESVCRNCMKKMQSLQHTRVSRKQNNPRAG
ncbi:hypothetical protein Hanom_Chr06g00532161 [Helianthus anomalus]